jgi:hypothetical protein
VTLAGRFVPHLCYVTSTKEDDNELKSVCRILGVKFLRVEQVDLLCMAYCMRLWMGHPFFWVYNAA